MRRGSHCSTITLRRSLSYPKPARNEFIGYSGPILSYFTLFYFHIYLLLTDIHGAVAEVVEIISALVEGRRLYHHFDTDCT
jgi:hypothetical protein